MDERPQVPVPSPELLYQISGTDDTSKFFESIRHLSDHTLHHLVRGGGAVTPGSAVLDFGCGVGKVLIGLNERVENLRLHGCDLDGQLIEWCQKNLPFADCHVNSLRPPLRYADNSFDVINAISVFTHLPIDSQFEWAWELFRVLKPGGRLHVTIHGLPFFGLFSWIAQNRSIHRQQIHSFADGGLFMEIEQPIENPRYQQKSGTDAYGQLEVAVAHNAGAVSSVFSSFEQVGAFPETSIGNGHDAYVLRKGMNAKLIPLTPSQSECLLGEHAEVGYSFAVNGQERMRVFVTANLPGAYATAMACEVAVTLNGQPLPPLLMDVCVGERFYGSSHYYCLDIPLPRAAVGNISVRLRPQAMNAGQHYVQGLRFLWPHTV